MQFAQDWVTKNVLGAIDGARDRCIHGQHGPDLGIGTLELREKAGG
jgi:hypothetical protein